MTGRPAFLPLRGAGHSRTAVLVSRSGGPTRCSRRGDPGPPRGRRAPARATRAGKPDVARPRASTPGRGATTHLVPVADVEGRGRRHDPYDRLRTSPGWPPLAAAQRPTSGCGTPRRSEPVGLGRGHRKIVRGWSLPRVEPLVILTRSHQCLYRGRSSPRASPAGLGAPHRKSRQGGPHSTGPARGPYSVGPITGSSPTASSAAPSTPWPTPW